MVIQLLKILKVPLLLFVLSFLPCLIFGFPKDDLILAIDPVTAIGAGVALAGIFGSIFSSASSNSTNVKLQRETNALNYKMFQEQQDYDWTKTQYQSNFMNSLMDKYNNYMSPVNLMARYKQAGINPFVAGSSALGQTQSQLPSGSPIGGAPSAVPMEAARVQPVFNSQDAVNATSSILQLASAQSEISDSKNKDVNTNRTQTLLTQEEKKMIIDNERQAFELQLRQKYGDDETQQRINTMLSEELANYANADMLNASISEISSRIKSNLAKADLDEQTAKKIEAEIPWIAKEMQQKLNTLKAQENAYQSESKYYQAASQNQLAQASEHIANARTTNELREGLKLLQGDQHFKNNQEIERAAQDIQIAWVKAGMDIAKFPIDYNTLHEKMRQNQIKTANDLYELYAAPIKDIMNAIQGNGQAAKNIPVITP